MRKIAALVVLVLAVAVVGAGIAVAGAGKDDETPITGTALDRASAAALAHTGGGRVTDTEAGDEDGAYEVEVTLANGSEVDVHLDAQFNVLGDETDGAGDDEKDDQDD